MNIRNRERKVQIFAALMAAIALSGCAWQRIPASPSFASPSPLPLTVGIQLSSSPASDLYGPKVVKLLKEMRVVDKTVYPYREDDEVDALLGIAIEGGWEGSGAAAGFVIGLTLGLLSPVVGPSMVGRHDLNATLTNKDDQIASHSAKIVTKVTWGIAGDSNEVAVKADDLQSRKIAVEIAEWLQTNRRHILERLK